jgi:SAM-dependent methyltransferase
MGKGELYMKSGALHIRFLPRLAPEEIPEEENLIQISRKYTGIYREKYREIIDIEETPEYFRRHLVRNYIYKGPVLEWYIRVKTRIEKDYDVFHRHLPKKGLITDIGCGYGFMAYMLMYLSHHRQIMGIDYDKEKIDVANHCPAKNERATFIEGDALSIELPDSEAFVISDVLHYMPEENQEKLVVKCIGKLKPGGILMIRDADREMKKEHFKTRLSEFFSTRIGFNRTPTEDKKLYFTSGKKIVSILESNGLAVEILEESRTMSNVIFVGRK